MCSACIAYLLHSFYFWFVSLDFRLSLASKGIYNVQLLLKQEYEAQTLPCHAKPRPGDGGRWTSPQRGTADDVASILVLDLLPPLACQGSECECECECAKDQKLRDSASTVSLRLVLKWPATDAVAIQVRSS